MITRAHLRGFSLVEVLVYLSLFVILVTASVGVVFSLNTLVERYKAETALYRSGTQVLEHALLSIRQGDQINLFSTIQASPATGRITIANPSTTTVISRVGNDLQLEINGTNYGSLLPDIVTVDGFTVYHYPRAEGEFVRVIIELSATIDGTTRTETFYGGAVVRGSI